MINCTPILFIRAICPPEYPEKSRLFPASLDILAVLCPTILSSARPKPRLQYDVIYMFLTWAAFSRQQSEYFSEDEGHEYHHRSLIFNTSYDE